MMVYVLTDKELGWDCVVGVYANIEDIYKEFIGEDLTCENLQEFNEIYVIHEETLITEVE
jgi:hypothetical protein